MKLKDILAISGQQGLFKFVSQGRASIIVESLTDGRRSGVPVNAKVNSLADVVIFADSGEMPLYKVLWAIRDKQGGTVALDPKAASGEELSNFFAEIVPDYDRDKVHLSDIKKIVLWYNVLQQHSLLDFELEPEDDSDNTKDKTATATAHTQSHKPVQQSAPRASTKAAGTAKILAPRKAQ
jgi:hypothetical protein